MDEVLKKLDSLAKDTLILSRNTLLVNLRFLDMALSKFEYTSGGVSLATDGEKLYYNPVHILKRFKSDKNRVTHDYLHVVLHCIFRHMFGGILDERKWDLACDIAVEGSICELELRSVETAGDAQRIDQITRLTGKIGALTAERIYRYLLDNELSEKQMTALEELFKADDHSVWYKHGDGGSEDGENDGDGENNGEDGDDGENGEGDGSNIISRAELRRKLSDEWKDVSERIQEEMETFARKQGDKAGSFMQNLREINRERYDYTEFLKKFAVRTEVMKINDDEFDYVFYTYGMKLYERMPLIEPLEYKDEKLIKEFVIAIDTSGSVEGELVQTFVQKTYNILKSTESFSRKINVHIIQCDAVIQDKVKITCQEEFDAYLKNMKLKGFGGTDFRPVFRYVDDLIAAKEFTNLKGLIYFTDGFGVFPSKKPAYDTAFVFIEESDFTKAVPSWAIKLVLKKDEI